MTFRPANRNELAAALRAANRGRSPVGIPDLRGFDRILEHTPEDMTVTVEAGVTLAALQTALAQRGQWLPVDPPQAGDLTIASLLSTNASGPRRYGFGTIRDHLIGLRVALADGRLVRSGGKVVKNVAGFDLLKLFVGARDTLGLIVEATFKLLPLPETERFVGATCPTHEACRQLMDAVLESELNPTVLDCHNLGLGEEGAVVVLGFSGTREDVEWQASQAAALGFKESATLEHERAFWDQSSPIVQRWSVLPSRLVEALRELRGVTFVARAGNGVIYHRGDPRAGSSLPTTLLRRVKEIFDPNHILPDLPV
jgi:glycolate oxidase FAD binding subunit